MIALNFWKLLPRALRERIVLWRIKSALIKAGVPRAFVEDIMSGWKTWAGAIGQIGAGLALIADGLLSDPMDLTKVFAGVALVGRGVADIGLGHKIEKAATKVA